MSHRFLTSAPQVDHERIHRAIETFADELVYRFCIGKCKKIQGHKENLECTDTDVETLKKKRRLTSAYATTGLKNRLLKRLDLGTRHSEEVQNVCRFLEMNSEKAHDMVHKLLKYFESNLVEWAKHHELKNDIDLRNAVRYIAFDPNNNAPYEQRQEFVADAVRRLFHAEEMVYFIRSLQKTAALVEEARVSAMEDFLCNVADDAMDLVATHLSHFELRNLRLTCKGFANMSVLRDRQPHFRIRHVVGTLPHVQTADGQNFVVANRALRVFVDYGLYKKGVPSAYADDDSDEEEMGHPNPKSWSLLNPEQLKIAQERKAVRLRRAKGPREVQKGCYTFKSMRVPNYIDGCDVKLVYADTRLPCVCPETGSDAKIRKKDELFTFTKSRGVVFMPAATKVTIPNTFYSREHNDRQFQLRVDVIKDNKSRRRIFSQPFYVVSKLSATSSRKRKHDDINNNNNNGSIPSTTIMLSPS